MKPTINPPIKAKGVPERPSEKKRARRARVLAQLPATQLRIHKRTKISSASISRWLADLIAAEEAHIGGWARSPHGGPFAAVYHPGPGEPVPCELEPLPRTVSYRRYRDNLRKDREREQADVAKAAAWVSTWTPRRDPLAEALFGAAA